MPFTGDFAGLRQLERSIEGMARPGGPGVKLVLGAMRTAIKGLIKQEFATGIGPDGEWQATKRGRPALLSRQLPKTFVAHIKETGVRFASLVKRDWLLAHQLGHTFTVRHVAAEKQFLTFNRKGRLVRNSRALNKKGEVRRGVHQTFARAHAVGERVLPAREIYPADGGLTSKWGEAIAGAVTAALERWYEHATKG